MKTVLVSAFLVFQATSSLAGMCIPMEYAEIKDTPSKNLVAHLCINDRWIKYHKAQHSFYFEASSAAMSDALMNGRPSSSIPGQPPYMRELNREVAELEKCAEIQNKITRVLQTRSDYETLECSQK